MKEAQRILERMKRTDVKKQKFGSPLNESPHRQKIDSKTKIKYVIFDFGGVLVVEGMRAARRLYKEKTGIDIEKIWYTEVRSVWKSLEKGENADGDFWEALERLVKPRDSRFDVNEFKKIIFENQRYNLEVVSLIKKLKAKGYVTALLTNNVKEWIEEWDRNDPLNQYFDVVVSSHEVKEIKPEPRIYQITLERLGAKPEECVFIDDKEKNIDTAIKLGMKGVIFKTPEQGIKEINEILN